MSKEAIALSKIQSSSRNQHYPIITITTIFKKSDLSHQN